MTLWDKRSKEERLAIRAEMLREARRVVAEQDPSLTEIEVGAMAINLVKSAIAHERRSSVLDHGHAMENC